ncbi:hypothetical protein [Umezawaea beigongshangensis]|uniref:hypothetical protein n=1 Tax=Umezawaea beigongshangensis TaxID=2780383 RepID=UPI0018F1249F|nr:hypothetical protein [Umezawaea beigongshangensis]
MADSYSASDTSTAPSIGRSSGTVRPLLWLALVVSAAGNVATSTAGLVAVSVVFGLLVLASAAALIVHHRSHRR